MSRPRPARFWTWGGTANRTDAAPPCSHPPSESCACRTLVHRLRLLTFLPSGEFRALLTTSPQPSSLALDGSRWASQNPLGSTGPSSGIEGAFKGAYPRGCLWSPAGRARRPHRSHTGPALLTSLLAGGCYPPGVKVGSMAGPGEAGVHWL